MNVAQEILEWSQHLPMWQRDALRRIMTTAELSQVDEDEIYALARAEYGLDPSEGLEVATPLVADHLPAQMTESASVTLLSIHDVAHVNALAAEQVLSFGPEGLTVVYGENATGKSGYSRVLKKACRARDPEPILPNVFEEADGTAEAKFDLLVGEEDVRVTWRDDGVPPDVLSAVAVFDSATARLFVDDENEVRYLPYGLDAFPRLGDLCGRIKQRLGQQSPRSGTASDPVTLLGDTEASRLMAALSADCCPIDAAALAYLGPTELKEIDALRAAQLQDPAIRARSLRSLVTRIRALRTRVELLVTPLSKEGVAELKRLSVEAQTSSSAARFASDTEFQQEPLQGVGSEAWRLMYEAARDFSERYAYPDASFPVTDDDSVCVLCQQPLVPQAAKRMRRFEEFVANKMAKKAASDEKAVQEKVKSLVGIGHRPEDADPALLDELREIDADCCESLLSELDSLRAARTQCLAALDSGDWSVVRVLAVKSPESLKSIADGFEKDAVEAEHSADPEEQARISARLKELEARKALGGQMPQVAGTIQRKRSERDLAKCVESADTNTITRKGGLLYKTAVTETLGARLHDELVAVGAAHLPLGLTDRGAAGKRLLRLAMSGIVKAATNPSRVLSEGEHRAVAIAAMLAECGLQGHAFPIVFDDPVCSLDHRYRERVAARLVKESQRRQVIVLTHDVFFLAELEAQAQQRSLPIRSIALKRVAGVVGLCDEGKPWRTMSVGERLDSCDRRAIGLEAVLESGNADEYEEQVGIVADRLRDALEEVVEEVVFNKVVTRFQDNVAVLRLDRVVFDGEDYNSVMASYGRLSTWSPAHAEGAGAMRVTPSPSELRSEVNEISDFVKRLKSRQNSAANDRKR